jgi:hypothetical protein
MFSKLRKQFGSAGLIVAIIALVAALATGAYAAGGGLSGKQKREVTSIAKKFAGKPGAPGAAGSAGTNGTNGTNGNDGTPGADGKSVEAEAASVAECADGGTRFKVNGVTKGKACNGQEGSPWAAGGILPSGATETGTYAGLVTEGQSALIPISLTLPVEPAPEPIYVEGASAPGCPGVVAEVPTADPGKLCLYKTLQAGGEEVDSRTFLTPLAVAPGSAPSGAILTFECISPACVRYGSWAVTAE